MVMRCVVLSWNNVQWPSRFSLFIVFSVADQSRSGVKTMICQIPHFYPASKMEHSERTFETNR